MFTRQWWRGHWLVAFPWVLVLTVALTTGAGYAISDSFRDEAHEVVNVLTSGDQELIRDYLRGYGALGPMVSVLLMVLQVIFAPIPASVVQLTNGVVYGQFWGSMLNLVSQSLGAIVAFYIARMLGKGMVEKLVGKITGDGFELWLARWGGKALFLTRAIPGMPSDFLSYVAGLTNLKPRTYILASFLGYIPQSIMYAWLGDYAMGWFWYIVAAGFGVSGIIGIITWFIQRRNRARRKQLLTAAATKSLKMIP